jgi:hypothetical protein
LLFVWLLAFAALLFAASCSLLPLQQKTKKPRIFVWVRRAKKGWMSFKSAKLAQEFVYLY